MQLKDFQHNALNTLKTYLEQARLTANPAQAFLDIVRQREPDQLFPRYRDLPGLPGVPNVCLRLPTGAGKTLLSAHTIAIAGRAYLEKDYPVVLWMVPTNTIRKQTTEALKNPSHPYRAAIDEAFDGRVSIFDISAVADIRPQDLTDQVSIIVCTLQTLRVNDKDGRRAYAHSESFEPHFAQIPDHTPWLPHAESGPRKGKIKYSFVNLMAIHQPLVIIDEAHKAGTHLSFEMLAALRPACIIEFTATPNADRKNGSNVLFRVSANQVKAEQMIKLPIILTEHQDWRAAVHDAIATRTQLAETAKNDPRYIRPLILFQAQDKGQDVTVEVLKNHLIEQENIAPERIAIATGEQRELDKYNLFDKACPIEFIITVEALKEGWDCSFAYVLCSVANINSATDIEQLLGRVLRMPYAQSRSHKALNRAYAHVSARFGEGARKLTDALVDKMGFNPDEAATALELRQAEIPELDATNDLFHRTPILMETVDVAPNLDKLDPEVIACVKVETPIDGAVTVVVSGDITEELEERLTASVKPERRAALQAAIHRHRIAWQNSIAPAERGEKFAVPRLFLNIQGELQLAEKELILDLGNWTLNTCPAELSLTEFSIQETAERWEIDLYGEKVGYKHLDQNIQLEIGLLKLDWTDGHLARFLDKECQQDDITQPVMLEFCRRMVAYLIEKRGINLNTLVRFKYPLAKAVRQKITAYRQAAYSQGYQHYLLGSQATVETRFTDKFSFGQRPYPAKWFYQGAYRFKKHFFGLVGELNFKGEEFECAQAIDTLPQIKYWIRNLDTRPKTSFWLLTSTDRFYPDFVAELEDQRVLVVEYKGANIVTADDAKEKRNIGELWAKKSQGKGLFLMAEKRDSQHRDIRGQISAVIGN